MRTYGHYCAVAHALDVLGDRWTMLIVRTLLLGPRRFTDLMRALPGMSSNLLTERIKSLAECGVVRSYEMPPPAASVVYELTPRGSELREVIVALAKWGNQTLGGPDQDHVVTPEAVAFFLAGVFYRGSSTGTALPPTRVEVVWGDEAFRFLVRADANGPKIEIGSSDPGEAVLEVELSALQPLSGGHRTLSAAIEDGSATLRGDSRAKDHILRWVDGSA